jgi:hypothetical protein
MIAIRWLASRAARRATATATGLPYTLPSGSTNPVMKS